MPVCAKTFLEGNAKQWLSLRNVNRIWGSILLKIYIYIYIYLAAPGLHCSTRDLVPWLGIESRLPALGTWSLSHWITREVSTFYFFRSFSILVKILLWFYSVGLSFFNCGSCKTYHVKFTFSDFEVYSSVVMATFTSCDTSVQLFYLGLSTFPSPLAITILLCFPDVEYCKSLM